MAALGTAAEARLLDLGAIPVALLRFDRDPIETVHRTGRVERLHVARARCEYQQAGPN
jgi:hypothetical protein